MHSKVCTAAISAALPESDLISSLAIPYIGHPIGHPISCPWPSRYRSIELSYHHLFHIAKNLSPVLKESSIQVELSYPLILSPPLSLRRSASYLHRSSASLPLSAPMISFALSPISSDDQLRYPCTSDHQPRYPISSDHLGYPIQLSYQLCYQLSYHLRWYIYIEGAQGPRAGLESDAMVLLL